MNAAGTLLDLVVGQLAPAALERLATLAPSRFDAMPSSSPAACGDPRLLLARRFGDDEVALLNACRAEELGRLARQLGLAPVAGAGARVGALRLLLWHALTAGAKSLARSPAPPAQPAPSSWPTASSPAVPIAAASPVLVGDRLLRCAPARGLAPPTAAWPRPLPPPRSAAPPDEEPECLDTLLDAADRALGVRLGARGRAGKGAWGQRAAELLGVVDRGDREPDWRGDVEIKTAAVAPSRSGAWRVVEDPAISTVGAAPIAKLQRVLWLCRADAPGGDATLISWYLLDWDDTVAALVERYLHVRPKGPRGSAGRGYYLHKRFFADAGLLASLNGPPLHDHR